MFYKKLGLKCNGVFFGAFDNVEVEVLSEKGLDCPDNCVNLYSVFIRFKGSIIFCVPSCKYAGVIEGILCIDK